MKWGTSSSTRIKQRYAPKYAIRDPKGQKLKQILTTPSPDSSFNGAEDISSP